MTHRADSPHSDATPGERLARTRREIVSYMKHESGQHSGQDKDRHSRPGIDAESDAPASAGDGPDERQEGGDSSGIWQTIQRTVAAWWHSHPGRLAVEVAEPVLQKYARAHPVKLLAIAAGVGAAVVLAKPWRLVSVTGLLVAALKSSQLSGMAASFMKGDDRRPP